MDVELASQLTSPDNVTQLSEKQLGKEDFLKILLSELSNQDPLNPVSDKDLILQLAQFSTLEGTQNLNENMDAYISSANISTATNLIGKEITYTDYDTGTEYIGKVDKVNVIGGSIYFEVNGMKIQMEQINDIADTMPTEEA